MQEKERERERTLHELLLLEPAAVVDVLGLLEDADALDLGQDLGERSLGVLERGGQERDELRRDGCGGRRGRAGGRGDEVCAQGRGQSSFSSGSPACNDDDEHDALFCETIKSRAVTSIDSGLMTRRSLVL